MKISINRNSGIFPKDLTDEINKAFSSVMDKMAEYKAEPLEYKEEVQYTQGGSFLCGNSLLCIRESYMVSGELGKFTTMGSLQVRKIPYEIWCNAITEKNESMQCVITNNEIRLYGVLSSYPQRVYISEDAVLPS